MQMGDFSTVQSTDKPLQTQNPANFAGFYFLCCIRLQNAVIYRVSTSYALRFHTINCVKPVLLRCASFSPKCNAAFRGTPRRSLFLQTLRLDLQGFDELWHSADRVSRI